LKRNSKGKLNKGGENCDVSAELCGVLFTFPFLLFIIPKKTNHLQFDFITGNAFKKKTCGQRKIITGKLTGDLIFLSFKT